MGGGGADFGVFPRSLSKSVRTVLVVRVQCRAPLPPPPTMAEWRVITRYPPAPLAFPTPGKTVPRHPLGDGHQVTVPHPPLGDRTTTVHAYLQAQKLQHREASNRRTVVQDGLAITVISDAAIYITVLQMSNDLHQNRFLRGADEHHICPRGKHGRAVKFHFSQSEQNVLP